MKVWTDCLGEYVIPPEVVVVTRFRKDGLLDRRFKNAVFQAWLKTAR